MNRLRRTAAVSIAVAGGALLSAGQASATNFCAVVSGTLPDCTAGNTSTGATTAVQAALDDAVGNIGPDKVIIGAGTFTTSSPGTAWNYSAGGTPGNDVEISGQGPSTILQPNGDPIPNYVLVISGTSLSTDSVHHLKVNIPASAGTNVTGILVSTNSPTDVHDVTVTAPSRAAGTVGVSLGSPGSTLRSSSIDIARFGVATQGTYGAVSNVTSGSPAPVIRDSTIAADYGIAAGSFVSSTDEKLTASGLRISATSDRNKTTMSTAGRCAFGWARPVRSAAVRPGRARARPLRNASRPVRADRPVVVGRLIAPMRHRPAGRSAQPVRGDAGSGGLGRPGRVQRRQLGMLLVGPGLEHRRLDHPRPLGHGHRAAKELFVLGDFRSGLSVDRRGALAPQLEQRIRHPDDVGLAVLVHLPKAHPEPLVHFVAQRGLVDHSGALLVMEQFGGIQRAPPAVGAPDLVQHQRVGVQLRVPGPAAAMVEHRRHQPRRADLLDPVRPAPGQRGVRVQVARPARTAARCAAIASAAVDESPSAHSALTLFGAENVRSNPVTPSVRHARPSRLPVPGCRPRANSASSSRSVTTEPADSPSCSSPRPCQRPGASPTPR